MSNVIHFPQRHRRVIRRNSSAIVIDLEAARLAREYHWDMDNDLLPTDEEVEEQARLAALAWFAEAERNARPKKRRATS